MDARDDITKIRRSSAPFWTGFPSADGSIITEYGKGDGIHLDDAAHAILEQRVGDAKIPETIFSARQ
jgi:hypothetical protein